MAEAVHRQVTGAGAAATTEAEAETAAEAEVEATTAAELKMPVTRTLLQLSKSECSAWRLR